MIKRLSSSRFRTIEWLGTGDERTRRKPYPSYSWRYVIRDRKDFLGRLHVSVQPAYRSQDGTDAEIFVLTLTARGKPLGKGVDGALAFLDFGACVDRPWFQGPDNTGDASNMAATGMNVALRPSARPAVVDLEFGSTLAATQIKVSGREHFATDGYIVVSSKPQANDAPICESVTGVTVVAQAFGTGPCNYVIVGEKTLAPSGNVTAATWARTFSPVTRPSFYPAIAVCSSKFWWTGNRPSVGASIKVQDRRLEPFYDRLARIERGEWDPELGKLPAKTALTKGWG